MTQIDGTRINYLTINSSHVMKKAIPTKAVKQKSSKALKKGPPINDRDLITEYDTSLCMIAEAASEVTCALQEVENGAIDWRGQLEQSLAALNSIKGQAQNIEDAIVVVLAQPSPSVSRAG